MIEKLNLFELQSMVAISKALNLASAADSLGIPKPTLQKHVESVERKIGERLFDRRQKNGEVLITSYGKEALPKIENILWLAQALSRESRFFAHTHNEGDVSIRTTQTLLEIFILPFFQGFISQNPR